MGVWGGAPSRVKGQSSWSGGGGRSPPEAEGILLPKRANLSLSFKWNLKILQLHAEKDRNGVPVIKKRTRNGVPVRSGSKRTLSLWADTPIAVHGFERESSSSAPTRSHAFCVVYTAWAKKPGLLGEEVDKLRNSCYRIFVVN